MTPTTPWMRFRVPAGWTVHGNDFSDLDGHVEAGGTPTDLTLLWMTYRMASWESHGANEAEYTLDLSWYPADDERPSAYTLTLLQAGWDDVVATVQHAERAVICDVVEGWLDRVVRSRDRAQLERWIASDKSS